MAASPWAEAAAASGASAGALLAWAVRGRSANVFGPNIWRGPEDLRAMSLTFDDGPSESTPALLDLLDQYGVKCTFFQVGANVRRVPRIARMVAERGHEIGNHSDTHPLMCFRSGSFVARELRSAQSTIQEFAGCTPSLYRAPFGVRWFGLRGALAELGLTGVMWTTIGRDWKCAGPQVAARMRQNFAQGAIFCLHDGRDLTVKPDITATLEAVERFLPAALARGYRFATVSDLVCRKISPAA